MSPPTQAIKRIPTFRCTTKGCPWPKNEAAHVPWCLHIEGVEHRRDQPWHQHHPKKGMGAGRTEARIVAVLCSYCSDKVDNTPDWDNALTPGEGGREEYILWDTRIEGGWATPLICRATEDPAAGEQSNREVVRDDTTPAAGSGREAGSAAADRVRAGGSVRLPTFPALSEGLRARNRPGQSAAAPPASPLSPAGEGAEAGVSCQPETLGRARPASPSPAAPSASGESSAGEVSEVEGEQPNATLISASPAPFSQLTHDERMGIAAEIRREQKQRQWKAGDTANAWERETTEAWQYLDEFGYTHPALSNIMHICENCPPPRRRESLSFAHHAVIHTYNAEDQEAWLDRAEQEGWTVRDFRIAVHGEKPKPMGVCPQCGHEEAYSRFKKGA